MPADTPLWQVSRVTPNDGGPTTVVGADNESGAGADYFAVEASYAAPTVRGLRLDGTEAWRRRVGTDVYVSTMMADGSGGLLVSTVDFSTPSGTGALTRIDGVTGAQSWRIERPGGFFSKPALHGSGRVIVPVSQDYDTYIAGIDPATGTVAFQQMVPRSLYGEGYWATDWITELTVGHDGEVYLAKQHVEIEGDMYSAVHHQWLQVFRVGSTGALAHVATLTELHQALEGYGAWYDQVLPGKVFPGASGGLVVNWFRLPGDTSQPSQSFVTTLNGSRIDAEAASAVDAVASDGAGYGNNGTGLAAIDVETGSARWQSNEGGEVLAVLADGSIVMKTSAGETKRVDSTGQPTALSGVADLQSVFIDSAEQRLMLAGGALIAVPGESLELDALFPLQDGNTRRHRARPEPALTVNRATVVRGETARFRISGLLPAEVTKWEFIADDSTLTTVLRDSAIQSLAWVGKVVAPGKVRVTWNRSGVEASVEQRVEVAARPGFSLTIAPPAAEQKSHGFDPDGPAGTQGPMVISRPPTPPIGTQAASAVGLSAFDVRYQFSRGVQITDEGPNHGLRPVNGIAPATGASAPYYVYVISPDFESDQEFYQRQCGSFGQANPQGVISGAVLRTNTFQHEAGAAGLSHYVQFVDALADPANDLGAAIEQIVVGGTAATSDESYDAVVNQKMGDGVLSRINAATSAEPCPTVAYDGSSGVCVFRGYMNYPPYQACP